MTVGSDAISRQCQNRVKLSDSQLALAELLGVGKTLTHPASEVKCSV